MSDMGDYFNDLKAHRKEQKRKWREGGGMFKEIENAKKISKSYTLHNDGEMMKLVVTGKNGDNIVNFWPSTRNWKVQNARASGQGVRGIIAYFKLDFQIINGDVKPKTTMQNYTANFVASVIGVN